MTSKLHTYLFDTYNILVTGGRYCLSETGPIQVLESYGGGYYRVVRLEGDPTVRFCTTETLFVPHEDRESLSLKMSKDIKLLNLYEDSLSGMADRIFGPPLNTTPSGLLN